MQNYLLHMSNDGHNKKKKYYKGFGELFFRDTESQTEYSPESHLSTLALNDDKATKVAAASFLSTWKARDRHHTDTSAE